MLGDLCCVLLIILSHYYYCIHDMIVFSWCLGQVFLPCWNSSPVVHEFMAKHNYTEVRDVEQHYVEKVLELAELTPLNYITWQDPADRGTKVHLSSQVKHLTCCHMLLFCFEF